MNVRTTSKTKETIRKNPAPKTLYFWVQGLIICKNIYPSISIPFSRKFSIHSCRYASSCSL